MSDKVDRIAPRRQLKRTVLKQGNAAETAFKHTKKAGIIGIVRDTPPDLSTNKKHFDGFGR